MGHPNVELAFIFPLFDLCWPLFDPRIQVIDRKQIVLTPIEVAIEDIQLKVAKLAAAIKESWAFNI